MAASVALRDPRRVERVQSCTFHPLLLGADDGLIRFKNSPDISSALQGTKPGHRCNLWVAERAAHKELIPAQKERGKKKKNAGPGTGREAASSKIKCVVLVALEGKPLGPKDNTNVQHPDKEGAEIQTKEMCGHG